MFVALAEIFTESVTAAPFTVIVRALDVDVAGVAQEPDGVITQVITLPLAKEDEVNVLPVPTTVVPTFH